MVWVSAQLCGRGCYIQLHMSTILMEGIGMCVFVPELTCTPVCDACWAFSVCCTLIFMAAQVCGMALPILCVCVHMYVSGSW
jgi:hypothetical protein